MLPTFVIKAEELAALNYLEPRHPRPIRLEWINRGTDQKLRPTTIQLLLRTIYRPQATPSIVRLHQSTGLRATFQLEADRVSFASAFARALAQYVAGQSYLVTAVFEGRDAAERAVLELKKSDIPANSISLLSLAGQFMGAAGRDGHTRSSVAAAVAGAGVAGAIFGVAIFAIPGIGPIAVAGAIAASASSTMAAVGGAFGATGGAIAKMLTDHDVDGRSIDFYEDQIHRGKVFVSVDTRIAKCKPNIARQIFLHHGGLTADGLLREFSVSKLTMQADA